MALILLISTWVIMIFVSGFNMFVLSFLGVIFISIIALLIIFFPTKFGYVFLRIKTFIDPELGQVGRIANVNTDLLISCLKDGYMPIIAPLGTEIDQESNATGRILNINGDTAAGEIACSMKSESIIFLTYLDGILDEEKKLIDHIDRDGINKLIESEIVAGGMIPKVEACIRALDGVDFAKIMDGRNSHALLSLNSTDRIGTRIR